MVLQRWLKGRPLFSCSDKEVTPITPNAVERTVGEIVKRLKLGGIKVEISPTETALPDKIQHQAAKEGATGEIQAVHHGDSFTSWLIS